MFPFSSSRWSAADIPDLTGKRAVVTGANSGLGLQTALQLARHGAQVTLACRNPERGQAALEKVQKVGEADLVALDLSDLASVKAFAFQGPLDILVLNAGIMAVPRSTTKDGFEAQLGTNHLGHFALAGGLLANLREADAARVVAVSSIAHRAGRIDFDDLQSEKHYERWTAYGQSKLANLLFIRELSRRLTHAGSTVTAASAHPGFAATNLQQGWAGVGAVKTVVDRASVLVTQSDASGALPSLYAATMPDVAPNDYFGPGGAGEIKGAPVRVGMTARAKDGQVATRLFDVSSELTGVTYDLPA